MNRAIGNRIRPYRLIAVTAVIAALAGCEEGVNLSGSTTEEKPSDTTEAGNTIELFPQADPGSQKDVEAPEVLQLTDSGLWDGRPSLGGIWVAHPDAEQPERVLIRNTANNKSVTGALFRRERNLPGPALQVSSLAAEQLGMLAGSPARIEVVALRRETIAPPPVAEAPAEDAETTDDAADDATDVAAADAPAAEEAPAKRKWWQKKETAGAAAAGVTAGAAVAGSGAEETAAAASDVAEVASAEEKPAKRKWWQKKPEKAEAAAGAAAATAATEVGDDAAATENAEVAATTLTDPEVTPPTEKPTKRKWWQKKDPAEITETPLDPIEGAAAAIDAADPTPVTAAAATTAAASAPATPSLSKPFVQAGTFSVEANAKSAAEKIRRNGMTADVRELQSEGKSIWRVLVGPAATRAERKAILSDVKDLGFSDAFTASN